MKRSPFSLFVLTLAPAFLALAFPAFGYQWQKVYQADRWGGEFRVLSATGKVRINGGEVDFSRTYVSRLRIVLFENAVLLGETGDRSVFMFKGDGVYDLELGTKVSSLIRVVRGQLTGIKNSDSDHLLMIQGVNVHFGIRGGLIFNYRNFDDAGTPVLDPEGNPFDHANRPSDHVCGMSGKLDYISSDFSRTEKIESLTSVFCEYVSYSGGLYGYVPGYAGYLLRDEVIALVNVASANIFDGGEIDLGSLPQPERPEGGESEGEEAESLPTEGNGSAPPPATGGDVTADDVTVDLRGEEI